MCTVNWKIKVSIVPSIYTEIMFFPIVFCNVKTSYYYAENHPPFKKKHIILRIISMNDCFSIASLHIIMQRTPPFKKKKTKQENMSFREFCSMNDCFSIPSWYKENNFFVHPQSVLLYFIWVCIEWIQSYFPKDYLQSVLILDFIWF